jgi:hypothetical protein
MQTLKIFITAFVVTLGITAVAAKTKASNDLQMEVVECTTTKWQEYENRTGEMPSVTLEQSWYAECRGGPK